LDRLPHRVVEVVNLLPDDEADATDGRRAIIAIVAFDVENLPPQALVRVNAEEGLT
jgi:hypothetical protein